MGSSLSLIAADATSKLSLAETTQFSESGIVSRAILSTRGLRVTLFGFAAGQELTEHASPLRAVVQVLTGKSVWTVAGSSLTVEAGEILHMPPGTPHAVRAEEAFSMLLTLVRETPAATSSAEPAGV